MLFVEFPSGKISSFFRLSMTVFKSFFSWTWAVSIRRAPLKGHFYQNYWRTPLISAIPMFIAYLLCFWWNHFLKKISHQGQHLKAGCSFGLELPLFPQNDICCFKNLLYSIFPHVPCFLNIHTKCFILTLV